MISLLKIFLFNFNWNDSLYSVRKSLPELVHIIIEEVKSSEDYIRTRMQSYNSIESIINKAMRDESGPLSTKDLTSILANRQIVETDFMTTILVVVPINEEKIFMANYEFFTKGVVPKSAEKINEDEKFILYSVVSLKNNAKSQYVEDFKTQARKFKFTERKNESNLFDKKKINELEEKLQGRKKKY